MGTTLCEKLWKQHCWVWSKYNACSDGVQQFMFCKGTLCFRLHKKACKHLSMTFPSDMFRTWYILVSDLFICFHLFMHFIPHSLILEICPSLTPFWSSKVELRCLPLGFFTNTFSHEAWSSFNMLFPALIALIEKDTRRKGEPGVGWFIVFALIPLTA